VFTETFRSRGVRSRVTLITAAVTSKSVYYNHFPVNLLRNVGLLNVMTSHVLVVDADMIPARMEMYGNELQIRCGLISIGFPHLFFSMILLLF